MKPKFFQVPTIKFFSLDASQVLRDCDRQYRIDWHYRINYSAPQEHAWEQCSYLLKRWPRRVPRGAKQLGPTNTGHKHTWQPINRIQKTFEVKYDWGWKTKMNFNKCGRGNKRGGQTFFEVLNQEEGNHSGCMDSKTIHSTIDAPPGVLWVSKNHIFFTNETVFLLR